MKSAYSIKSYSCISKRQGNVQVPMQGECSNTDAPFAAATTVPSWSGHRERPRATPVLVAGCNCAVPGLAGNRGSDIEGPPWSACSFPTSPLQVSPTVWEQVWEGGTCVPLPSSPANAGTRGVRGGAEHFCPVNSAGDSSISAQVTPSSTCSQPVVGRAPTGKQGQIGSRAQKENFPGQAWLPAQLLPTVPGWVKARYSYSGTSRGLLPLLLFIPVWKGKWGIMVKHLYNDTPEFTPFPCQLFAPPLPAKEL